MILTEVLYEAAIELAQWKALEEEKMDAPAQFAYWESQQKSVERLKQEVAHTPWWNPKPPAE